MYFILCKPKHEDVFTLRQQDISCHPEALNLCFPDVCSAVLILWMLSRSPDTIKAVGRLGLLCGVSTCDGTAVACALKILTWYRRQHCTAYEVLPRHDMFYNVDHSML